MGMGGRDDIREQALLTSRRTWREYSAVLSSPEPELAVTDPTRVLLKTWLFIPKPIGTCPHEYALRMTAQVRDNKMCTKALTLSEPYDFQSFLLNVNVRFTPISDHQVKSGHPPIGLGMAFCEFSYFQVISPGITKGCSCFMFQSTIVIKSNPPA